MPSGFQLTLFGLGLGKDHLFGPKILEQYLREHEGTRIPDEAESSRGLREWLASLDGTTATEKSLKTKFISEVLCKIFSYTAYPVPSGVAASLYPEPPKKVTGIGRSPDAVLGRFIDSDFQFTVAVELKTPGTDLDLPQPSYDNESPVQQGFYYGKNILGVRWVIVSDMRFVRLYSVESQGEFEEIDFALCIEADGSPTETYRRLHFLLHHDYLVHGHEVSQISTLYAKSTARRLEVRDSFYKAYYTIRTDLYEAIRLASTELDPVPARLELLEATQRLLDRLLFIYYCEDHPQHFIEQDTVKTVTEAASRLPGRSTFKVYQCLKELFREVDSGSSAGSGVNIPAYNGELFKEHRILDHIELPDSLHRKTYDLDGETGGRKIHGAWGLHVYDFWTELNEHLLGHIFEESLSDLEDLGTGTVRSAEDRLEERRRCGIFFTTSILSDFLSESALHALLGELAPIGGNTDAELVASLENRLDRLLHLRVADLACGSGAFLVSVYREMLQEFSRLRTSINRLKVILGRAELNLLTIVESSEQAQLLRDCVFGSDKLPQAVEIAKLALWLRSARKDEKVLDLSANLIAADSLNVPNLFAKLGIRSGAFDLVIGNPPWGGEIEPEVYRKAVSDLGLSEDGPKWDSWELFLILALKALREGGRLALVLPDSFFYSDKARIRRLLFALATPEKVHNLGPDWFGQRVRMGTVIIQARRGSLDLNASIRCLLLAGNLRGRAIRGEVPLTQIEAQRARLVPVSRPAESSTYELEVFRGVGDDSIMNRMVCRSFLLETVCERGRGEEMSKSGLFWVCPSCLAPTTPGKKKKGGGYKAKKCPSCDHTLTETSVQENELVSDAQLPEGDSVPFIDGDDVNRRFQKVMPSKWLRLNLPGWQYKTPELYKPPKILVRQAGVGLVATLDETNARCPQSVYIYRLGCHEEAKHYQLEFILGALLSRTMAYFVFKRFAEVDPAKAHAKLTHDRLAGLPIPKVDFNNPDQRKMHAAVAKDTRMLLDGKSPVGGEEDRAIEQTLRELWGISSEEGAYINGEFYDLPDSQVLRDLFPQGRPKPPPPLGAESAGVKKLPKDERQAPSVQESAQPRGSRP
jgi:hypothetical protein